MDFTMQFIKYHALGNDYLKYAEDSTFNLNVEQIQRVCDRHYGLGADGILVLEERTPERFKLRIINPDGSDAEKSGDGLRIFSRYLRDRSWVKSAWFEIDPRWAGGCSRHSGRTIRRSGNVKLRGHVIKMAA
jgi:diaminopimelate epimerase